MLFSQVTRRAAAFAGTTTTTAARPVRGFSQMTANGPLGASIGRVSPLTSLSGFSAMNAMKAAPARVPVVAHGSLVRLASTASSASASAPAPTPAPKTTYMPPKPRARRSFFATLGKVFAALVLVPAVLSLVFPDLIAFLVPAATLITAGAVVVLTAALALGVVLPLLTICAVAAAIPSAIVFTELYKMRKAHKFDSVAWEIGVPRRPWHFETSAEAEEIDNGTHTGRKAYNKRRQLVHIDTESKDGGAFEVVGPVATRVVDFFVDIGAIVETEIMRRDLMGHSDTAGPYPNVVTIQGKNIGFFGPLMSRVSIPIDRAFIRAKIAERATGSKPVKAEKIEKVEKPVVATPSRVEAAKAAVQRFTVTKKQPVVEDSSEKRIDFN
ncbi:hypothetical protein BCR33DRAFT_714411 [Rhizoclosmatium globosum]|uniref:Uncharacterized protein n=1 Tax=Rhizoclosmatium globosum TaxID=329046 RepID=A0A1Y2CNR8_9FUNG|nr:hypothetical protein BCR33DRAFT_714411 [Rhizoclosmatium globosum]|eukprot:ORY48680.1 hypothetical protein BCR33DRAFT_714411 [Rhizoclosmatium globosum]